MNEIRLAQSTVLRLAPGIIWDETQPGSVTVRRGRTRWAAAIRRGLAVVGGVLVVAAGCAAGFMAGTGVGAGFSMADLEAGSASATPAMSMPSAPPQPPQQQRAAGRSQPRQGNPDDPFGVR